MPESVQWAKLELVKAFMRFEGRLQALDAWYSRASGTVTFSGYDKEGKYRKITLDSRQVELLEDCDTVMRIYECYREMGYFEEATK